MSLELCAGAGGLSLGLEQGGFTPLALIDNKPDACATLLTNRPHWPVLETDLTDFLPSDRPDLFPPDTDIDLLAAGLPRLPSAASGPSHTSEREHFLLKAVVWLTQATRPRALLIENVPGLVRDATYEPVRAWVEDHLAEIGYAYDWRVLDAQDFGVPQRRPHGFLVALRDGTPPSWPSPRQTPCGDVGSVLATSMAAGGWPGASAWAARADRPAPTVVGGSDRRGGADLGPTGSKRSWEKLGVNGGGVADAVPDVHAAVNLLPKLTVAQVALLQGFPSQWRISGRKTSSYRQVGNACPPPLAAAVAGSIARDLSAAGPYDPSKITP
ncbi:DNA cytosine methyltransferase [Streptomyces diastaticus]|uniref:DNA (cytosine-5-)-methyltransferase n=1 Tax=Streptomyces griseus TaxID=1911 RepID=A0A380MR45_STRGR|nr:DNA cytosine methyltransferase [Streptomyces griseus]WSU35899.1 DNA cytosine methyltransferase [Streptomyces gougerotii]SUO94644.1 5-methylcytosine methyltransferase [Streptomyces griseus]